VSSLDIGFWSLPVILLLIAARIPIGAALGAVALVGIAIVRNPETALTLLQSTPFEFGSSWSLSAIPMFLLMGSIAHNSGISHALFRAARLWLSGLPGGLAVATNLACAGFAAASGSSVATAAAMGRIAIPEMLAHGYDKGLATGVVASAGTLGSLIPPSILFVLYGIFAETSVTKLLIAGILPGVLTAAVYASMLVGRCLMFPELAPKVEIKSTTREKWQALFEIWPVALLILGMIGGLLFGLVTPTEAGAYGAFLAYLIAFAQGRLNWAVLRTSVMESVAATSRLLFVAVGAILLTKFLALSGLPFYLADAMGAWALDPVLLIVGVSVVYIILGMFLDPLGIMLITIPVFVPMFEKLGLNLIWFGVLVVKYLEIGLLTPPVGFNVYVIKTVVGDEIPLETIFKGVGWFLACEVVIMTLLIAYPQISLYLPSLMD
jgi:C4-dicarboxylate transporter, DctM subunit